ERLRFEAPLAGETLGEETVLLLHLGGEERHTLAQRRVLPLEPPRGGDEGRERAAQADELARLGPAVAGERQCLTGGSHSPCPARRAARRAAAAIRPITPASACAAGSTASARAAAAPDPSSAARAARASPA